MLQLISILLLAILFLIPAVIATTYVVMGLNLIRKGKEELNNFKIKSGKVTILNAIAGFVLFVCLACGLLYVVW